MAATPTDNGPVRVGFWYSPIEVPIPVANIPSENFTHLLAAFADVNLTTYEVTFPKGFEVQFSTFTQTVQKRNEKVKTLISIGGDHSRSFPSMVREPETRKAFIDSSISLARNNNFHGLGLNWLYPATGEEMTNLGKLLVEWRNAVVQESKWTGTDQLLLVAAVSYRPERRSLRYPFQEISDNLDWINVLAYDYYSPVPSRNVTGPFAALYDDETSAAPNKFRCGDFGLNRWLEAPVPPQKIVFGLPFYGYAWRLQDDNGNIDRGLFAPADGPADGEAHGVFINPSDGTMFYNQIKYFISKNEIQPTFDNDYVVDYCSAGNAWIGYNDVESIKAKVRYAKDKGLRGYYAWHVGGDKDGTLSNAAIDAWPNKDLPAHQASKGSSHAPKQSNNRR